MNLILETICKYCNAGRCINHNSSMIIKDDVTGLEIEARCVCESCNAKGGKNNGK